MSRIDEDMASPEDPLLDSEESDFARPLGLTGLQNLGNTCYMNAALQALSNCPQLTGFMTDCSSFIVKPGLAKAYLRLIRDMWSDRRHSYVVPSGISQGIKKVCPAFKGYSQHDAQEFLRCLLDQLHEELKEPVITPSSERTDRSHVRQARRMRKKFAIPASSSTKNDGGSDSRAASDEGPNSTDDEDDDGDYETCDSGLSWERSTTTSADKISGHNIEVCECDSPSMSNGIVHVPIGEAEGESGIYSMSSLPQTSTSVSSSTTLCPKEEVTSSSPLSGQRSAKLSKRRYADSTPSPSSQTQYRSIVSDIFDGRILSSVQCLTCDNVSTTRETFQDLSLSIPTRDQLNVLRASRKSSMSSMDGESPSSGRSSPSTVSMASNGTTNMSSENYSWIWSWIEWIFGLFWGPSIALEDCLSAFFSADELKGDNMYSCEKCKKLRNGIKYSKVTQLPDILCIHLKRFRHELMYSSKISSQVTFPLDGLDMSPYVISDPDEDEKKDDDHPGKDKITTYDLVSVICHHGTPASGHYTAYCLNSYSDTWYEFDDQYVTAVDPHQVAACEAYVLFYRKNSEEVCQGRLRTVQLIERSMSDPNHSSQPDFFISNQWINRFNTFAEPGPITNYDILCHHGRVAPSKSAIIKDLCTAFSRDVYEYMVNKYGGGPPFTCLDACAICLEGEKVNGQRIVTDNFMRRFLHNVDYHKNVMRACSPSPSGNSGLLVSLADSSVTEEMMEMQTTEASSQYAPPSHYACLPSSLGATTTSIL